jgi:hypothetical protein
MRYERLISDVRAELSRLAGFIGVPANSKWLDQACHFVDSGRVGGAESRLHPSELAELRKACTFGNQAFDLLEAEWAAPPGQTA